jgi:tetratricopeptide (TPR) repeat protein
MKKMLAIIISLIMLQSCSLLSINQQPIDTQQKESTKGLFNKGYTFFSQDHYQKALPLFHAYLEKETPDADNYEWALFFYGICLNKEKLSYAAFDVFARLIDQSPNAKIVTHAIRLFEQAINQKLIHESFIRETALCTKNLGFVEAPLSHFIDFHQGMCNWEKGYIDWGNAQFSMIPENSFYYFKYRFEMARLKIHQKQIDEGVHILKDLLNSSQINSAMRARCHITLARLYFEQKKFDEADQLYQTIAKFQKDQSRFLLERAWTQFHLNHPNQAMGLLIALNAPDFKSQKTPEYFLLKSLIYKQICNYQKALAIVDDWHAKYHKVIKGIRKRQPLANQANIIPLLLLKKPINKTIAIIHRLTHEQRLAGTIMNKNVADDLTNVYELFIQKQAHALRIMAQAAYVEMSDTLLSFEENMRLMHYEIGLSMYQRVKESRRGLEMKPSEKIIYEQPVIYPFVGEYWNDELDDLRVSLTDKCQTPEQWDVFFK